MQLQSPAYNLVQGPLLQMLIIQAAYMKAAGLQQMAAMETLMRENFFTASITALVPGVGLMLAAGGGQRSLLQGGRPGRCHATPGAFGRLAAPPTALTHSAPCRRQAQDPAPPPPLASPLAPLSHQAAAHDAA